MSASVRWVACTTVVPGPSSAVVVEQPGRGDAVRRQAGVVLGDLLGEVDVQRRPRPPRRRGSWSRGTARTEWIAARRAVVGRQRDALGPPLRVAVAVAELDALGRRAEAAAEVAGVEQRDPDPGLARPPRRSAWPIALGSSYGVRRAGGAGSGTRPRVVMPAATISR